MTRSSDSKNRTEWLITGAGGQLGSVLMRRLSESGRSSLGIVSPSGPRPSVGDHTPLDITDFAAVRDLIERVRPDIIIHAAGVTQVQIAHQRPDLARRTNVEATTALVGAADRVGARFVFASTDMVFDGLAPPYDERAPVSPLSVYGRTKSEAEKFVTAYARGLVVRLPLMYGLPAVDRPTTFRAQLEAIWRGDPLRLFEDEYRTPIWLEDAAAACIFSGHSDALGILHAGGPERLSRLEMGRIMAQTMGKSDAQIIASKRADAAAAETRPADISLDSAGFAGMLGKPAGRTMAEAMREIARASGLS